MSSDHDAQWNMRAKLAWDGLRHGGTCPIHLKPFTDCGCKEGFEDPGPVMTCAECGRQCHGSAFTNKEGKTFPWCIECRRKRVGKKKPTNWRMSQSKYLET